MTDTTYQTALHLTRAAPRTSYAVHQAITAVQPPGPRVLWARPEPGRLIIRTPHPADWSRIPGTHTSTTTRCRTRYPLGTTLAWALIANPTRASRSGVTTGPDGKPHGRGARRPVADCDVPDWARRKLGSALATSPDSVRTQQIPPARGRGITLTRWAISGTGTVHDPDELARMLTCGIGPGKAFGCGLLLVQEAPA